MIIEDVRLLTCTESGGVFEKGKIYPFYVFDGYAYMLVVYSVNSKSEFIRLDSYEDGTYKIVGTWDDWENAEFREEVN